MQRFVIGALLSLAATTLAAVRFEPTVAVPHRIVFKGGPLREIVVMEDSSENHRLMSSLGRMRMAPPDMRHRRPRIEFTIYWGPQGTEPRPTNDTMNVQRGEYYPAFRNQEALWVFAPSGRLPSSTREIDPAGIEILVHSGLPRAAR